MREIYNIMKRNYIDKYNTPRVFQVFSTIAFISLPILMFVLDVFDFHDAFSKEWIYGRSTLLWKRNIFYIFYRNFGCFDSGNTAELLAEIIVVVAAITGIVFIWLNRPKISGICGVMLLLIMLLSLLRIYDSDGYYTTLGGTFLRVIVEDTYYILWGLLAFLAVFVVLSIVFTKDGPREPKAVMVVQTAQQFQISSADEIKKLKELCVSGVITQEEFDAKKKEILGL